MYFSILKFILINSLIAITSAFNPHYIQLKSKFNDMSLYHGLAHIHTPEHVKHTHIIGAPLFKIHNVYNPINYNNISSIYFTCSVLNLDKMFVKMHSKYANSCEMNFFLKNKEFITLQITILPDLANSNNHYFLLKVFIDETLKPLLPIIKIFFQISMFISVTEDKLFFNSKNKITYYTNFNKYRQLVFQKINYLKFNWRNYWYFF